MKILIGDSDPSIVESVGASCASRWPYRDLLSTSSYDELLNMVETESPDLVLLDSELPDTQCEAACREIRAFSAVPLVMITPSHDEYEIVRALDAGADDCVSKPIRPMELVARIVALLRRTQRLPMTGSAQPYLSDDLYVDFDTYEVKVQGQDVKLTFTEFEILKFLVTNPRRVISHSQLGWQIWGEDGECSRNVLKVHIQHLRQKLGESASDPHYIVNERGLGYKFAAA